jgi:3-dehydroquinate synthase
VGIALDSLYSCHSGLIGEIELRRILTTLEGIGFAVYHPALSWIDVGRALREFQEHLGGKLTIPLLEGIGEKVERHDIDAERYRRCIGILARRRWSGNVSRSGKAEGEMENAAALQHLPVV